MDPYNNLQEQLRLAAYIRAVAEHPSCNSSDIEEFYEDASRLADLVIALNEWIEAGGHLPWKVK
jgi:hypothetical protein